MTSTRLAKLKRGDPFEIKVDGKALLAYEGETVATVMLGAGIRAFHQDARGGCASRLYCGMGVCMQCLIVVDGVMSCRACKTLARPGMEVETTDGSHDV
jgi:predicted molibdopterin-dependent oxidoreductase YjgC